MPVWVVSSNESAERDRAAIDNGTPSRQLMERAGTAAAQEISLRYANRLRDGAVVFTGPGNNGGDGWVVARTLAASGIDVTVVEIAKPTKEKSPDAVAEREAALASVRVADSFDDEAAVVVDALLGTGFSGQPRGKLGAAIAAINELHRRGTLVASLDVPSGLDASTGEHSACVAADITLSFGGLKRGTLVARDCCGEIVVLDIGLDDRRTSARPESIDELHLPILVDADWVASRVPPIHFDAHKGARKHLAILGGGKGMPGAVVLTTRAALRSGIGMVRALVAPDNVSSVLTAVPSALISEWPSSDDQINAEISNWAHATVIGPGLGKSTATRKLVDRVLRASAIPILLDADALNVFEGDAKSLATLLTGKTALITPHVGEFARLAGLESRAVLANRFDVGLDLARQLGVVVLLKGSPTVIFTPQGDRYVVARGTAALGTGGSGDLLDGIAGTMLAQTQDSVVAACCAAWIHGRAAEFCQYVRGTSLDDILYALPRAWNELEPPPEPPVLAQLPMVGR